MGAEPLAVSVDVELDGGRRDHASKTGTETAEEGSPSFGLVDVANDSGSPVACVFGDGGGGRRHGGGLGRTLIEVGLEACSQDIEGRCGDSSCETTAPVESWALVADLSDG